MSFEPRVVIVVNAEGMVVAAMESSEGDDVSVRLIAPADHVVVETDLPAELHQHDEQERVRRVLGYRWLDDAGVLAAS
jgi:hypothetical protein